MEFEQHGEAGTGDRASRVYSIGHSNHSAEEFVQLVTAHRIEVIADVRSQPWSRYSPQFNRDALKATLREAGVDYVFLGNLLGGRPEGDDFYDEEGHVRYDRTAEAPFFREGLDRLCAGAQRFKVAMLCSEGMPNECHRHLLVARVLRSRGVQVVHVLPNGNLVDEAQITDTPTQARLFGEGEQPWRSVRSVSRSTALASSSESSESPALIG